MEIEYLSDQSQTLTYERFAADETLRRAFVRSLEIIGEAVKNLPTKQRDRKSPFRILHRSSGNFP